MSTDTWLGTSGDWSVASDWSNGGPPAATDNAVVAAPGSYAVTLFGTASVGGVTLDASGAEFYDSGALALSGTFALQAGTLALAYGTLAGGTLAMDGGQFQSTGGTLDGVAVQGTLNLGAPGTTLFVRDGLLLSGAGGSGAGSIAVTGGYAALDFVGSQTLNNATISLGATGGLPGQAGPATLGITHAGGATSGATLTLGSTLWLRQAGNAGVSGVLAVGANGVLPGATLPDMLVNQGTITASVASATLDVSGSGTFVNQGTIAISNGATLEIATAGFVNTGTIAVSNATLALGGTFSAGLLSGLGAVTLSAGQIEILGTASNTGGTLSLGAALPFGPISLAGTIVGGTVLDSGGGLSFASGTGVLDGALYMGTLNLAGAGAAVTLTDGARVTTASGAAGSIVDTGSGAALLLRGAETLDNATVLLGGNGPAASTLATNDVWLASSGTTATLGAHLLVQQTGLQAALQANGWSPVPGIGPTDTLINQGTITAGVAGGRLSISGYGTFVNQGAITVGGGDTLAVTVGQFANAGTLTAAAGGTVLLGEPAGPFGAAPAWSNAGQIAVNGGTLVLAGAFTTGQLGTITESAGSVQLAGTLSNAGATLSLGTHGGAVIVPGLSLTGTIAGGAIVDGAGALAAGAGDTALLDGVSYQGTLALTQAGAFLRVRDGMTLNGVAEVLGAGSVLDFQGSQTFDHAQIMLGATGSAAAIDLLHDPSSTSGNTLTLGSGLAITQSGALATIGRAGGVAGDLIVNAGTISASVLGGLFSVGGPGFLNEGRINVSNSDTLSISAPVFSNTGSIAVSGGVLSLAGSLSLAGLGQVSLSNALLSVGGTLNLGGGTLAVGQGTAIGRLSLTGTLANGTIADAGGGLACVGGATLDDATYAGLLDLSRPFSQLAVGQGLTLETQTGGKPGAILLTGAQARLIATTSETIDNAAITLGSPSQIYAGQHIAPPELAAAAGVQLTLGAGVVVTASGTDGVLGDSGLGQWSDSIVNAGQIDSAVPLAVLNIDSSFFTNAGIIAASSGGYVAFDDTGIVNSGLISVGAGSAVLTALYDFYAAPNAGPASFTNAGTIAMQGGTFQEQTANGLFPAVPIANLASGTIVGDGLLFAEVANAGTIEAQGGLLQLAQPVSGNGSLLIGSGGTLELQSTIPAGQKIGFVSTGGTLKLDSPSTFTGTISGFGAGDAIDLPTQILTGVGLASGTLVLSAATQNFRISSTTPLGGAVIEQRDAHGGSLVNFVAQTVDQGGPSQVILPVDQPNMLFWTSPAGDLLRGIAADITGAHISNWSAADSIDLTDLQFGNAALALTQSAFATTISVSDGSHAATVILNGTFTSSQFHLAADGSGGTMLTYGHH